MTKKLLFLSLLSIFAYIKNADAQTIKLRNGQHDLSALEPANIDPSYSEAIFGQYFYGLITLKSLDQIKQENIIAWLNSQTALVKIPLDQAKKVDYLYKLPLSWKINPELHNSLTVNSEVTLRVNLYQYNTQIENKLKELGSIGFYNGLNKSMLITLNSDSLLSLIKMPFIFWAELPAPALETHNLRERTNHRVPLIQNSTGPFQLTGKDVIIGEWDGGGADEHIDYRLSSTPL